MSLTANERKRYKSLATISTELEAHVTKMYKAVEDCSDIIDPLAGNQKKSAMNLIQYLTLRSEDIRDLQDQLHIYGLSSLASSESHILYQVQSILQRLGRSFAPDEMSGCDYYTGKQLIESRSKQLFGRRKSQTNPSLMITFDTEFADNYQLIKKLLESGMNVARINTAHDNAEIWGNMISLVHEASEKTGIPCKIYMDLAGPKMRVSILGKGRLAGKIMLSEEQEIQLAEHDADFDPSVLVIGCDEPGITNQLKSGDRILFDDGLIETAVLSNKAGIARLKVKRVSSKKHQLKAGKGINFPDSKLELPSLSKYDISTLPFICEHAELVGYSFIRKAADLKVLQEELSRYSKRPSVILKIETPDAVMNFPSLLIQGMQEEIFGVMIARGDLAVEIGFERMSEIQEEILWISEAAHVPVIWATQVLETLNKSGIATRSEITDAAYAAMSECVMINKGDYIINVMKSLNDILKRSGSHHVKKRYTFRPMRIASDFFNKLPKS